MKFIVNIEELRNVNWQEELEKNGSTFLPECNIVFQNRMQKAIEEEDDIAEKVYCLLGGLTSLKLDPDSKSDPYKTQQPFSRIWQTFSIDKIHSSTFSSLKTLLKEIKNEEIRSRIGDVLWVFNRDYESAKIAVQSYLNSVEKAYSVNNILNVKKILERSIGLGAQLSRDSEIYKKAIGFLESKIEEYSNNQDYALSFDLQSILLNHNEGRPGKYIQICKELIEECENEKNWILVRKLWELKSNWFRRDNDEKGVKNSINSLAHTFEREVEQELEKESPSYLKISHFIERAIQAYRQTDGNREKVKKLHSELVQYQKKSLSELEKRSYNLDVSEFAKESIRLVEGKSFKDAFFELCYLAKPTNFQHLKKRTIESANKYVFHTLFPALIMNEEGKTVARQTSSLLGDNEEANRAIFERMCQDSKYYYQVVVEGNILPALNQIQMEHRIDLNDILELLNYSPWVPLDRKYMFAKAFKAGFYQEWEIVANLLIPQIEHSVRQVLIQNGTILPTSIDMSGIQKEYDLNTTLNMNELTDILGEDVVFDLQSILISPFGSNLRNRQAHGLISDIGFYSTEVVYIWWLNIRISLVALMVHEKGNANDL